MERQLFSSHTLASGCCSLRDEKRFFMDRDVQFPPTQQGKVSVYSFQQNLFQVERKVSSSSLLEVLPVNREKHRAGST